MPSSKPSTPPVVWSIAGTDPTCGAGIQADLKTFQGLEVQGCTVITAVLAQNSMGVQRSDCLAREIVAAQLESLRADTSPAAIKIGMLGTASTIHAVAEICSRLKAPAICDPLILSTSGTPLLDPGALEDLAALLFPHLALLTPNRPEAEHLTGMSIRSPKDVEWAAARLLSMGTKAVLIKGGHDAGEWARDFWTDGHSHAWLSSPRIHTRHTHGGGCTLSSAIAAAMALGFSELDALVIAKAYVNQGLRHSKPLGKGRGALAHLGWPADPKDLPIITLDADRPASLSFPEIREIGLYPIVDRADWVGRLLALGVRTVQLRAKDLTGDALEQEVARAVQLGKERKARVFINDHWQLALRHHAFGVHIGQDDLPTTDIAALREAGLRLGISTHGYAEAARALAARPSYIAIGTIFKSPSKTFAHAPMGVAAFARLRKLVNVPVVAIGGITRARANELLAAGADGLAVISDVTGASDLPQRLREWNALTSPPDPPA